MRLEQLVTISAPADRVFSTVADVERWPTWTDSMTSVTLLHPGPLRLGSDARIKQPRLPTVVWTVTDYQPGTSFTWVARSVGVRTIASHTVTSADAGVTIALTIDQAGPIGALLGLAMRRLTRRYLAMEAQGLKRHCEG